jgi:uncharacterized membrane protein
MGHAHVHTAVDHASLRITDTARRLLLGAVVALVVITVAGAVWLWPRGPLPHNAAADTVHQDTMTATVVSVSRRTCPGTTDDRLPDGALAPSVACASVKVRLTDATQRGKVVSVQVTGPTVEEGLAPGVGALVARFPDATGQIGVGQDVYAWVDFDRAQPMWLLLGIFVIVVLAVARLRGVAALIGVGLGFAMILLFLLPALRRGENPVAVTLVGSVAVMLVVLYASHGVSAKTTCALLGTVAALLVTAGLGSWAASAAHLDGQTGEDALSLSQLVGSGTVSAAVISGMVLAGLGVLNDVTVTQASAVWELKAAAPHLDGRHLWTRGMRIGRDHLASTVYTLAFAYAGLSLAVLLLIQAYDRPLTEVVTSAPIAQDVVGVLAGGIGVALAIPLTTAMASLVVGRATLLNPDAPSGDTSIPRHPLVAAKPRPAPGEEAIPDAEDAFEEGVVFRRRRREQRHPRPAEEDQLGLDASDWSSWPT